MIQMVTTGDALSSRLLFSLESLSLHKIVHYLKDKIGVVYFRCCVIFDTL